MVALSGPKPAIQKKAVIKKIKSEKTKSTSPKVTYEKPKLRKVKNMLKILTKESVEFSSLHGFVICIEGIIGIGKSTLGRSLCEFLKHHNFKVNYFPEVINPKFLKLYLSDMKKYAFSFQISALQNRFEIHRRAAEFAAKGGIAIIDRGLYGDMAFAWMQVRKGFFSPDELAAYNEQITMQELYNPSFILHLVCDPSVSIKRVQVRDRVGETGKKGYTKQYMKDLHEAHQETLQNYEGPLLTMNWNQDHDVSDGTIEYDICKNVLRKMIKSVNKYYSC